MTIFLICKMNLQSLFLPVFSFEWRIISKNC